MIYLVEIKFVQPIWTILLTTIIFSYNWVNVIGPVTLVRDAASETTVAYVRSQDGWIRKSKIESFICLIKRTHQQSVTPWKVWTAFILFNKWRFHISELSPLLWLVLVLCRQTQSYLTLHSNTILLVAQAYILDDMVQCVYRNPNRFVENGNNNHLQILSVFTLCTSIESAVYKSLLLADNYFIVKVLNQK